MIRPAPPHEPLPGVELARTLAGRPLHRVRVFLLGDTLIDSGPPATASEVAAWARDRGVRRVVHTHHHEDHTGGDRRLARDLGVEILATPATAAILADWYPVPLYRRLVWGRPLSQPAKPFGAEIVGPDWRLVPMPTPGHSHDHVALFEPERRWLFSGDLYVAPRIRYLRRIENAWEQIASLERLLELRPAGLFCAHAGWIADAEPALRHRRDDWLALAARARDLHSGGASVDEIRRRLLGREGLFTTLSGGDFSKRNLVASLLFDRAGAPRGGARSLEDGSPG